MSKKQKVEKCCCTPNCKYFPQEVSQGDILSIRKENGVTMRSVRRYCLYDGALIKSWSQPCSRVIPLYINPVTGLEEAL